MLKIKVILSNAIKRKFEKSFRRAVQMTTYLVYKFILDLKNLRFSFDRNKHLILICCIHIMVLINVFIL